MKDNLKEITVDVLFAEMEDFYTNIFSVCDEIMDCQRYLSNKSAVEDFGPSVFIHDIADPLITYIERVFEDYDSIVDMLQNWTLKVDDKILEAERDELILKLVEKNIQDMSMSRETALVRLLERSLEYP